MFFFSVHFQHKKPIYLTTNLMSCDNGTIFNLIESSTKGKTSWHFTPHTLVPMGTWQNVDSIRCATTQDKNRDLNEKKIPKIEIKLRWACEKKKLKLAHFFSYQFLFVFFFSHLIKCELSWGPFNWVIYEPIFFVVYCKMDAFLFGQQKNKNKREMIDHVHFLTPAKKVEIDRIVMTWTRKR